MRSTKMPVYEELYSRAALNEQRVASVDNFCIPTNIRASRARVRTADDDASDL